MTPNSTNTVPQCDDLLAVNTDDFKVEMKSEALSLLDPHAAFGGALV